MSVEFENGWLRASSLDLANIKHIIDDEQLTPVVAFHAQQSIEKSLKSLLARKKIDVPKIHSLNNLFHILQKDFDLKDYTIINKLDKLYVESRYPSELGLMPYGAPTMDDANIFFNFAKEIFDRVCTILDINKSDVMK